MAMVSRAGLRRYTLLLLCCVASLLSSYAVPTRQPNETERRKIIIELQHQSKTLLEEYQKAEKGTSKPSNHILPFGTCNPQQPNNSNCSVMLAHFQKIREHLDETNANITKPADAIIQQLKKLSFQDTEKEVVVPTTGFQRKHFIWAVLQQFSDCVHREPMSCKRPS